MGLISRVSSRTYRNGGEITMPKTRRVFIESSDEEPELLIKRKEVKCAKKKQPPKKKPKLDYDSSESGSDLSFVVSDSDDENEQAKQVQKFQTKTAELKSILGVKKITESQFQGRLTKDLFKFFNEKIFNGKLSA